MTMPDAPCPDADQVEEPDHPVDRRPSRRDDRSERLLIRREPPARPAEPRPRRTMHTRRPLADPQRAAAASGLGFFRGLLIAAPLSVLLWLVIVRIGQALLR